MKGKIIVVAAVLVALATGLSLASSAQAAPGSARAAFPAAARAAGYTAGQAEHLQREVDHYLRLVGGRQVAINQIDFDGGRVLVPLPGETTARRLGAKRTDGSCEVYTLCVWNRPNYKGSNVVLLKCNVYFNMNWPAVGSYRNMQTRGTVAFFYAGYDRHGGTWGRTTAQFSQPYANWAPVHSVQACGSESTG